MSEKVLIRQDELDEKIDTINRVFAEVGIERSELAQLDHIAIRTETLEEYVRVLENGRELGKDLGETEVEGRPITIIELREPLESGGWIINFLEIVAPKASSPYPSGLEHAEFVTNGQLSSFEAKHTDLNFIRNAMHRKLNPELKFREHGISVKFHQLNIGAVVAIESALGPLATEE